MIDDPNEILEDIAPGKHASVNALALEAITDVFHRMPFGQEIQLSNGDKAVIKKFVEPRVGDDGKAYFGFDVNEANQRWHLEFYVRQTGWGAAVDEPVPVTMPEDPAG